MNDVIISKDDQLNIWEFSIKLSKSQMVPKHFIGRPEDVFVSILYGRELGLNPIMSLNAICVIQGQVTLKVNTMTGVILKNHPKAIIDIKQDEIKKEVVITFKRDANDPAPYVSTWNMQKAKDMGLAGKQNYISQPLTMLRARALSEGYRVKFGDTLLGFYSTEEIEDLPPIREDNAGKVLTAMQSSIDEDFPISIEDRTYGKTYRILNGKLRGKTFGECDLFELEEYLIDLRSRKTHKSWEKELISAIDDYVVNFNIYNVKEEDDDETN